MKIVFVDIDGVLHGDKWLFETYSNNWPSLERENDHKWFQKECVDRLNSITEKGNARIIIHSSWRHFRTQDELTELFKKVGITGRVLGVTEGQVRHRSIESCLLDNPEIEKFVVLDDLASAWNGPELIHIDAVFGLQDSHIKEALKILNGQVD